MEDGGTPAFLQTIKSALALQLKDEMGRENILAREHGVTKLFGKNFQNLKIRTC